VISRNGIELADPRLNLFRTAGACVSWQEFTTPNALIAHYTVHWRLNGGTIERYRPEEQRALPSFDRLERRSATSKTHSLQLRGPV
jgi:hypothetical protein